LEKEIKMYGKIATLDIFKWRRVLERYSTSEIQTVKRLGKSITTPTDRPAAFGVIDQYRVARRPLGCHFPAFWWA
jgi:hypothetical protein